MLQSDSTEAGSKYDCFWITEQHAEILQKKKKTQPPPKKHHTTKTKQLQKAHTKKTHTTNLIPLWTGAYNKAKYRINRGGGVGGGGGQI